MNRIEINNQTSSKVFEIHSHQGHPSVDKNKIHFIGNEQFEQSSQQPITE